MVDVYRGHKKKLFKRRFCLDIRNSVFSNRVWLIIGIHYLHSVLIAALLIRLRSIFSKLRYMLLLSIARPSVVCLSSVTLVRPTLAVEIFRNISKAFGTLAVR